MSNLNNNNISVQCLNTSINQQYFTNHSYFDKSSPMTLDTYTLASVGQPTKSLLTIIPFFEGIKAFDIEELTN